MEHFNITNKNVVVLANIGNRNIRYRDQGYPNDEIPKKVFFSKTKFLWEHLQELPNVSLAILPAIIEKFPKAKYYIFSSLQQPAFEQDTYYEGLIIGRLLKDQFPDLELELMPIEGVRMNREEELIPWYRSRINQIRKRHNDAFYVMYDTGGTPQQKNSLKSVVEFYFRRNISGSGISDQTYLLYQGDDDGLGGTSVEEIRRSASESLSALTNIKLLIYHNNYSAAKELISSDYLKNLYNLLHYASLRWENMWSELDRIYKMENFSKQIKQLKNFDVISDADLAQIKISDELILDLPPKVFRYCENLLSKVLNQKESGDFTAAILSFHQFIETYLYGYIEANSPFKLYSDYRNAGTTLIDHLESEHKESIEFIFGSSRTVISLPVVLIYAEILANNNEVHKDLFRKIKATQSFFKSEDYPQNKKLDSLRNAAAHEGKGVTRTDFDLYKPFFDFAYGKFVKKTDPFRRINQLIEELM